MAEYLPKFAPGTAMTLTAGTSVVGGQLVAVTAPNTVAPTTAPSPSVLGVAGFDAAEGRSVTVYGSGVHRLTAKAAITAGQLVEAAADGTVAPHAVGTNDANAVGLAITSADAGGGVVVKVA